MAALLCGLAGCTTTREAADAGVPQCPPGQSSPTFPGLCEPAGGCGSLPTCGECGPNMGRLGLESSACGWCTNTNRCVLAYLSREDAAARAGVSPYAITIPRLAEDVYACAADRAAEPQQASDSACCTGYDELCHGTCVAIAKDPANCHGCGLACDAGQSCCPTGCATLSSDFSNCGRCGNSCQNGQTCVNGVCAGTACPGATNCGNACVSLTGDVHNCGACGHACGTNEVCSGGTCQCPLTCGATCVDPQSDSSNCGGCGNVCPSGTSCQMGSCKLCGANGDPCNIGGQCCSTVCSTKYWFSPSTTTASSGTCCTKSPGSACTTDQECCSPHPNSIAFCSAAGRCDDCPWPSFVCSGACVDLTSNPAHCGQCRIACLPGTSCINGSCGVCPAPNVMCGGSCVNLMTDVNNCGSCYHACGPGQHCQSGACVSCTPSCAGRHCGPDAVCGYSGFCGSCPAGQHCDGTYNCVSGSCVPSCAHPCGSDGCGGSCGTCPSGQSCGPGGVCTATSTGGACPDWSACLSTVVSQANSSCLASGYRLTVTNMCTQTVQYEYCFQRLDGTCDCGAGTVGGGVTLNSPGDYACNSTGQVRVYGTDPAGWGICVSFRQGCVRATAAALYGADLEQEVGPWRSGSKQETTQTLSS